MRIMRIWTFYKFVIVLFILVRSKFQFSSQIIYLFLAIILFGVVGRDIVLSFLFLNVWFLVSLLTYNIKSYWCIFVFLNISRGVMRLWQFAWLYLLFPIVDNLFSVYLNYFYLATFDSSVSQLFRIEFE